MIDVLLRTAGPEEYTSRILKLGEEGDPLVPGKDEIWFPVTESVAAAVRWLKQHGIEFACHIVRDGEALQLQFENEEEFMLFALSHPEAIEP